MELTTNFEFDSCKKKTKYSIQHENIPISMSRDLREAIYYLLWYVPNIKSEQSEKNELLTSAQYDDYLFIELMKAMGLADTDVLFTEVITDQMINPFLEEICTNESKLIMTLASGETKTMAVLRHIRNAIAHGNFNVIDNVVVGFDIQRYEDSIEYRGFFKIDPTKLLAALKKIQFDYNSQKLISSAFRNTGYFVEAYQEKYKRSHEFELFARKNGKKYAIDIKNYDYEKFIEPKLVDKLIDQYEGLLEGITPILIIHSSYLDEKSKARLLRHEVIILDVKNIKKMIAGRDMVAEIERAQLAKKMVEREKNDTNKSDQ